MTGKSIIEQPGSDPGVSQPAKMNMFRRLMQSRRSKVLMVIVLSVLVLGAAGVGGWLFFMDTSDDTESGAADVASKSDSQEQPGNSVQTEPEFEDIVTLEPFERLPMKPSESMETISLNLSLELVDPAMKPDILAQTERIRMAVESAVRDMSWMNLRNPDGKIKLKFKLIKSINALMPETSVRDVYFTLFLMQ